MNKHRLLMIGISACFLCLSAQIVRSQGNPATATVQVHIVITDTALREDAELPRLQKEDVKVKQGKSFLQVTQLIPAEGDNAALQLMILIDDTLNTSIGNSLTELKEFISAQPASTVVGVGYMSNAGVNIAQNFTADKDLAVKAVRLPRGNLSTMDSPYLSLISLVKGWQQQKVRAGGTGCVCGEQRHAGAVGRRSRGVVNRVPRLVQKPNRHRYAGHRDSISIFDGDRPGCRGSFANAWRVHGNGVHVNRWTERSVRYGGRRGLHGRVRTRILGRANVEAAALRDRRSEIIADAQQQRLMYFINTFFRFKFFRCQFYYGHILRSPYCTLRK